MFLSSPLVERLRERLAFLISPVSLAALALGSVALVAVITLWGSRVTAHRDALLYVDNHAQIAEEHARLALREVVDSLRVATGILGNASLAGARGDLNPFVDRIRSLSPRIERVAIFDAEGNLIAGDSDGTSASPFEAREEVSGGAFTVRASDEFVLVDLPFENRDGKQEGVVRGGIPREYFENFYSTINIRPGSVVGLILPNGDVAVREGSDRGENLALPSEFAGQEPGGASLVTVDGEARFQTYRLLPDVPVLVFSALDARTVFGPWWNDVRLFGGIIAVLAVIQWILGRVVVRAQTRRRWLASIVESSGEAIWSRDREGRIASWNRGAEQLFGYSADEVVGRHISVLWPPEEAERLSVLMSRVNDQGYYNHESDAVRRRKDGSSVSVAVNGSPIFDKTGQVIGAAVTARDISDKKEVEARLYRLAYYDALVDLPNRALLEEKLTSAVKRSTKDKAPLAFHYLDLDHFKDVNDSFGHRTGDQLLKEVASRIGEVVRRQDVVGRLGGDEFGIIQHNVTDESDAAQLAERILARLSAPFRIEGREMTAGVSIGTAVMSTEESEALGAEEAARSLFQRADIAMYAAKTAGRQRHSIYADHHGDKVRRKMDIQESLARAVRAGSLDIRFQPQVELESARMVGAEALVRWTDPERGAQTPSEFIEIAEQTGLIVPLGAWVLREACRAAASWPDRDLVVAVNVSAVQLRRGGLFDLIRETLEETNLPPQRLELELTESALFRDTEDVTSLLWALRALGVRLAVDDFGTGYSTLSYFKDFPVDKLKIDRTFIEGLAPSSRTLSIVRAASAMADGLGLELVAEGIETEMQRDLLRQVGVSRGQGFLFAKPMTTEALAAQIARVDNVVSIDQASAD